MERLTTRTVAGISSLPRSGMVTNGFVAGFDAAPSSFRYVGQNFAARAADQAHHRRAGRYYFAQLRQHLIGGAGERRHYIIERTLLVEGGQVALQGS